MRKDAIGNKGCDGNRWSVIAFSSRLESLLLSNDLTCEGNEVPRVKTRWVYIVRKLGLRVEG